MCAALPCFGGSQLAIDVTLRSAATDGAVLTQALVDKEYPEILTPVGVTWWMSPSRQAIGDEADFVWQLAQAKSAKCLLS